jgi:putative ABC transport system permease protein
MAARGLTFLLLQKFALRHWQAAPRQSTLLVLILALGIAVFFSIRLANRAALASFQNFTDLITQESDWLIQAPAGPAAGIPVARIARTLEPATRRHHSRPRDHRRTPAD